MRVRPATATDVPAIAQVAVDAYRSAFSSILEPEALALRDSAFFAGLFAPDLASLHVAVADGRVVGFSKVTATHLDMLFIAPAAQGRGAGRALLIAAEASGVCTLECFRDNQPARRFYEHHGWRLTRSYERDFVGKPRAFVFYEKP